jgi:glycosyltransferase A (GT-A) superfamily protein (DUF2064 family)
MSAPLPVTLVVVAKAPVPGRVKTRLCPPCTPAQAAALAAAALADTISTVDATPVAARCLLLSGRYPTPAGWWVVAQRGADLGERLAHGLADSARPGAAALLIGMDTPQATPALLTAVAGGLERADAVVAPALDGGWWALALRDPYAAGVLRRVPMSTPGTAVATVAALRRVGLRVVTGPSLRDVDTFADAVAVAELCPSGGFAGAVRSLPAARLREPV